MDNNREDTQQAILNNEPSFENLVWTKVSNEAKDFIIKCFEKNYEKRPSIDHLIDHTWIKKWID